MSRFNHGKIKTSHIDGWSYIRTSYYMELVETNIQLLQALKLAQTIIGHPDDESSQLIASLIAKAERVEVKK